MSPDILNVTGNSTVLTALGTIAQQQLDGLAVDGACPASPLMALPTSSAKLGPMMQNLPAFIKSAFQSNHWDAMALGSSSIYKLVNWSIIPGPNGGADQGQMRNITNSSHVLAEHQHVTADHSSLLSNVQFLKNLTRYPRVNKVFITTIEGQIITIIVVVCFILVFLIREWVVQQQPGVNMGAGFDAELARERRLNALQEELQAAAEELAREMPRREGADIGGRVPVDVGDRPIARPRRRAARIEEEERVPGIDRAPEETLPDFEVDHNGTPLPTDANNDQGGIRNRRPVMPTRDALTSAAEIQRRLTEESSTSTSDSIVAGEFISIWRRANGSPEEVLRIIETEGLDEKLRYWKNAMISLNQGPAQRQIREPDFEHANTNRATLQIIGDTKSSDTYQTNFQEPRDSDGNENDVYSHVPSRDRKVWLGHSNSSVLRDSADDENNELSRNPVLDEEAVSLGNGKGKEKAVDAPVEPLLDIQDTESGRTDLEPSHLTFSTELTSRSSQNQGPFQSSPLRQRAASDGPRIKDSISPLASNSWTFTKLPSTAEFAAPADDTQGIPEELAWKSAQDIRVRDAINRGRESKNNIPRMEFPSTPGTDGSVHPSSSLQPESANHQSVTRATYPWDEMSAETTFSDSEAVAAQDLRQSGHEARNTAPQDVPFDSDAREPPPADDEQSPPTAAVPILPDNPQDGFFGRVADWLWGDLVVPLDMPPGDDEQVVRDIAAEAPFVPVAQNNGFLGEDEHDDGADVQDREVVAAALAAGIDPNDQDALDDAEDFDGIMELVGMRGPLAGLVQNGLFSAVLISLTVALGVWVPYNFGRLVILLAANPTSTMKLPLKIVFSLAAVLQDLTLVFLGSIAYLLLKLCMLPNLLISITADGPAASTDMPTPGLALECIQIANHAGERILDGLVGALIHLPESEVPAFSAVSHEALLQIKDAIAFTLHTVSSFGAALFIESPARIIWKSCIDWFSVSRSILTFGSRTWENISAMSALMGRSDSWVITLNMPEREIPVDPSLSNWSGGDRFWAVLAGYIAFCFMGAAYLRKGSPFSSSQTGREWEATIIDILNQAGGVMKVILIISIEMLVFPLYCGLLLDMALLPLFDNATMLSRAVFTIDTPLTSIFVHWFVGTCYMFHFALFVSMCRKIMRSGVLCKFSSPYKLKPFN